MKKILLTLLTLTLFFLLFSAQTRITVSAAENSSSDETTIKVSAKNGSDISDKLREALINARDLAESSGQIITVKVKKGDYYLSKSLHIYSNTTLDVTDVHFTYQGTKKINMVISGTNAPYRGYEHFNSSEGCSGYDAFENITVLGGIWESTPENAGSMIRLFHARNVTLDGLTLIGGGCVHQMEVAAIDGFYVRNCTFLDHGKSADSTTNFQKQESIQLDMPYSNLVYPGVYQDGTPMKNVEITHNTFRNIARGVGTHTMLCGSYHENINISNNTFENVLEECIICLNYVNCQIKDNTITNCGGGILVENARDYDRSMNTSILDGSKVYAGATIHDLNTEISGNTIQIVYHPTTLIVAGIYVYGKDISDDALGGDGYPLPKGNHYISSISIRDNTIITAGDGITISDARNCEIAGNSIKGAKFSKKDPYARYRDGIRVDKQSSDISITGNSIKNMSRNGIVIYDRSSLSGIVNNNIKSCSKSGIKLTEHSICANDITNNIIKKCSFGGLIVENNSTTSDIIGNTLSAVSGNPAIKISNMSTVRYINSNQIYDLGEYRKKEVASGIVVSGRSTSKGIESNRIYASKSKYSSGYGILIDSDSRLSESVSNNTISNTNEYSIAVKSYSKIAGQINRNDITSARKSAIAVTDSSIICDNIESNHISGSGTNGILLDKKATVRNSIAGNVITECNNYGINIQSIENDLTVAHNELNENKNAAINIAAGKKNLTTISGNILSGSASISGIRLSKCKVSIASNEFEKFKYGIHAAASVSGSIYDNIYSDIAKKEIYIDKKAQKMNTVISSTVETTTDNGKNKATITWDAVKGMDGYELQYSTYADFSSKQVIHLNAKQTSYTLHDLPNNKPVYYRIRAYKTVENICIFGNFQTNYFILR